MLLHTHTHTHTHTHQTWGCCSFHEMCLKLPWRKRLNLRAPTHTEDGDAASSGRASGLFSSKDISSDFTSSSRSSLSGTLLKGLLPQGPLFYSRSEIAAATLNFHASQQIGSSAWKGLLRGSPVAVVQKPGIAKNFNKLLRNMHVLHHTNLAKLVGACAAADSVFAVYELVHGNSLRSCLSNALSPGYTVLSTWRLRIQVAMDVAKGLEYVHQHTIAQSAHKYLTSSNILITNEALHAKLALVGMSVLTREVNGIDTADDLGHKEAVVRDGVANEVSDTSSKPQKIDASQRKKRLAYSSSIRIKATHGYIPPEYALSGAVSQKYDVFSFGIILLELLKGEGMKSRKVTIPDEVRSVLSDEMGARGSLRLWIDRRLNDSYPVEDALKVVRLALSCVEEDPHKRPTMSKVALRMALFLDSAEVWEKGRSTFTGTGTLEGR